MTLMRAILMLFALVLAPSLAFTQTKLSAQARLDPYKSVIEDRILGGTSITLSLSQGLPYRIYTQSGPNRVVIEFSILDFVNLDVVDINKSQQIERVNFAELKNGWSRLELVLSAPLIVVRSGMEISDETSEAILSVALRQTDQATFDGTLASSTAQGFADQQTALTASPDDFDDGRLVIVLDPGHGGVDPGAQAGDVKEADLMLELARRLRDLLRRADLVDVIMTRDDDIFVPLEERISIAHAARADVFLSLHADKVTEGIAQGATVYTLAQTATDDASAKLAERHDRTEILTGVDLRGADDEVAGILLDLARQDTQPRSERLAQILVGKFSETLQVIETRPHRRANFSVLKAADIPSVLIEAGFMSSKKDLANLTSAEWQDQFAIAVVNALLDWYVEDQKQARLRRQ